MTQTLQAAISGASGRMGLAIIRELANTPDVALAAAFVSRKSAMLGRDCGEAAGIAAAGVAFSPLRDCEGLNVLLDFSRPSAIEANLELCRSRKAGIVVGSTGLDEAQNALIADAARHIPVLCAANTSVGVNLCAALVETAARVLGGVMDIEITETHHRAKVDAPSGTALLLGEAAATGAGLDLDRNAVFSREGHTGARPAHAIGFSAIRGGDVAGEHTVLFLGENERLEITHRATDRVIFARGALRAARWLHGRPPGLYAMHDVLDLN